MEKVGELIFGMNKSFKTADHLAFVTFPLLNDPKILVQILWNLNKAMLLGMEAFLYYEKSYKRIRSYPENFESRFEIFCRSIVPRYKIKGEHVSLLAELNELINKRERSPMEFRRRHEYVICEDSYKIRKINLPLVKDYIIKAKPFILLVSNLLRDDIRRRR